jgi:hypothetical protein
MKKKMTRRELAGAVLAATAATAAAQAPPSTPANPGEELQAAHEQNRRSSEALTKVSIPMDTEPAFHFTA